MKTIATLGLIFAFSSHAVFANEPDHRQFSVKDFEELSSVLFWSIQIPEDAKAGESYGALWHGDIQEGEEETRLVFRNVKPGTWVKVFLNVNALIYGDNSEHIRFTYKYTGENGKEIRKSGKINIPEGFYDLYGFDQCGEMKDKNGFLMLQGKKEKSTYAKACFLKLDFVDAK